ncbi:MAG: thioesterase family protein [Polyangiaceae bacterium]
MALFDDDTATSEISDNHFRSRISERYNVGPIPNGGYVMTVALAAMLKKFPGREPLTTTMHYLRPPAVGDVETIVEIVKDGKRYATAAARMVQNGKEIGRLLATFGSFEHPDPKAATMVAGAPPPLAPLEESIAMPDLDFFHIGRAFEQRIDPSTASFLEGKPNGAALLVGRVRFRDDRQPDVLSLPLFCDALPPPVFHIVPAAWTPTLELTVHVRARPAPGWLRFKFESRFVFGGLLEEDGELWDERGVLVAQSRQLAQIPAI